MKGAQCINHLWWGIHFFSVSLQKNIPSFLIVSEIPICFLVCTSCSTFDQDHSTMSWWPSFSQTLLKYLSDFRGYHTLCESCDNMWMNSFYPSCTPPTPFCVYYWPFEHPCHKRQTLGWMWSFNVWEQSKSSSYYCNAVMAYVPWLPYDGSVSERADDHSFFSKTLNWCGILWFINKRIQSGCHQWK